MVVWEHTAVYSSILGVSKIRERVALILGARLISGCLVAQIRLGP